MLLSLYRYRRYILRNAWNDLRLRYAGSGMGIFWHILLPLAQILIYTVVFSRLMSLRSPGMAANPYGFVIYLCSGLLPWLAFSNSVINGSNTFLANAKYLQKLPIPEEIFVARSAMADMFGLMIYIILLMIVIPMLGHALGWSSLLLPLAALLFQLFAFGLQLLLAPLRVFLRDIGYMLGVVMQLWMWMLPIVYVETILPPDFQSLLQWNPAYVYIRSFRDLLLQNQIPSWTAWGAMLAWATVFLLLGYTVLQRLRPELRDVL
ncbi:MAG: ABC transporter permease [Anaerolineae bacterium]|nr:ABC transporter permease [Anaerolineae bacterium]